MERIIAIIQARMGSTRFPGKSLTPLLGEPMIIRVVERVREATGISEVVVATSDQPADDPLAVELKKRDVAVFRGSLENVQQRYYDAAITFKADLVMRVTGDNPLIDPDLMTAQVKTWQHDWWDYIACADCIPGVGMELFTMEAFMRARGLTKDDYDREHVTPPFYRNKEHFRMCYIPVPEHLKPQAGIRLTVDLPDDHKRMVQYYEKFYNNGHIANTDVVGYLQTCRKT